MTAPPQHKEAGPSDPDVVVTIAHQPILDVARGTAAGYHAVATVPHGMLLDEVDRRVVAVQLIDAALDASTTLPVNTFTSVPLPLDLAGLPGIRARLAAHGSLAGVVLDVTDFDSDSVAAAEPALRAYRQAGARIAVGGRDDTQPELGSIVRLRPSIIRLGAAWTQGIDTHASRRTAIEVTGQLAGQLDAWILADAVATSGELSTLAQLGVPLARGPFIGGPGPAWPATSAASRRALPAPAAAAAPAAGRLRAFLQPAYTTREDLRELLTDPGAEGVACVVVVDDFERPVALAQRSADGRWTPSDVLTVNVDTSVTDVVGRAMARPGEQRLAPAACTDDEGRLLGVVRVERLVTHLADEHAQLLADTGR